ncbi:MAG: 2-amino-4-hydroxy-6-hydroxymethyldihydropteridine diphosphokinase [Muribaculaceae bacterium]|nr:2-amino-4-hydroxy-6-hydroxymethyldihydropteridine diphosphokinase [Muribaculaceae bacterium]
MALVAVNIGSNLGNRKELILTALDKISLKFGICCLSSFIESDPWGFESDNRFLNLGVSFKTDQNPEDLLTALQEIEKSICKNKHRDEHGNYIDREIDIDIMAIDNIKYESERLVVPHPHLMERDFFLLPLRELMPHWPLEK